MRTSTFSPTLCGIQEKPTAQTAHLVFADTKANAEKPKELFFANAATKNCKRACLSPTLPDKRNEKKYDRTTMAIRKAGKSTDMKAITLNKLTAKRKVKCLKIPHYE